MSNKYIQITYLLLYIYIYIYICLTWIYTFLNYDKKVVIVETGSYVTFTAISYLHHSRP